MGIRWQRVALAGIALSLGACAIVPYPYAGAGDTYPAPVAVVPAPAVVVPAPLFVGPRIFFWGGYRHGHGRGYRRH